MARRGLWKKEEGTEEERLEERTRVVLKFWEEICLQSSMQGKRWPDPEDVTTKISPVVIFTRKILLVLWVLIRAYRKTLNQGKKKVDWDLGGKFQKELVGPDCLVFNDDLNDISKVWLGNRTLDNVQTLEFS
ncbi:hypothetical protein F0562_011921 [Nyssa sinensis]|uniref:Uncharacterized protein n=1 Tax=Nyssa sinensis TaxID=561372 RepID=A0A5J4ZV12_9ASTE|nr:hypothetical protein F0562_011921 [Nyssa sinensis]